MKLKTLGLGALTAVLATLGSATAMANGGYTWYDNQYYPLAFSYTYYADAAKTQPLGTVTDTCVTSYDPMYAAQVSVPYIPTAYYDEEFIYHCGDMGPVLLP
ncbi:hypothetical protein [Brevundimonas sp. FT23028]|uniref:hypothetical protein n=1 Tax=Brevundimonas sp. FT23028 TaxID=3393748 RepID=UPI003B586CBD